MKVIILLVLSITAQAETEISCWNIFAKRGAPAILTAQIVQETNLDKVTWDLKDDLFSSYFQDEVGDAGENWGHKPTFTKSFIANPSEVLTAKIISSSRSPYKGHHEYSFKFGQYTFKAPYIDQVVDYNARLILPIDLSAESLKNARLRGAGERMNGLLIYTPAVASHQSGDNYLKLFCLSK